MSRPARWYDTWPLGSDRGRTLLIAGRIQRRAKAKRLARDALTEAHREFTAFGAAAWAAQAGAELARVNLRPAAPGTLTETERRVAELAAASLANREVAQQLFLAVKTVEAQSGPGVPQAGHHVPGRARCPDGTPGALTGPGPCGRSGSRKTAATTRSQRSRACSLLAATRWALTASNRNRTTSSPGIRMLPR